MKRCRWAEENALMCDYYDTEWGVPVRDGRLLWETLMLESFQAGLSWLIVLRKREAFHRAFAGFDPEAVALFSEEDVMRLMQDEGMVRSEAKIRATIEGARIYCAMQKAGEDFATFCWSFTWGRTICAGSP